MKLASVLAVLVVCLCVLQAVAQNPGDQTFVDAFNNKYGWEVIFANNTSFLDEINEHRGVIYVSSDGRVREIVEEPFSLSYHHQFFREQHRFLDFKVFYDFHNNQSYVLGVSDPIGVQGSVGVGHVVGIANTTDGDTAFIPPVHGDSFQMAALTATYMEDANGFPHVVAYMAGWRVRNGEGFRDAVPVANLSVVRLFVHPGRTANHNGTFISFNPYDNRNESDHVVLPDFGYVEYSRGYKPWIFHSNRSEVVFLVDPATRAVYKFNAPNNPNISFTYTGSSYQPAFSTHNITSARFDYERERLYIGTRGSGTEPGTVVAIDCSNGNMMPLWSKTLNQWESNPRALGHHGYHSLYVGLYGGATIMHLNVTLSGQTVGYSTMPWYIRDISALHAGERHIYVVTNEQYGKVARTLKTDFCPTPCDFFYGYCNNGTCACHPSHKLDANGYSCSPNYGTAKSSHGGEVALGLLFAICFVAAVLGWFVVWRQKNGLPVPVLDKFFQGGNSRYSLVHAEEKENFLGSD